MDGELGGWNTVSSHQPDKRFFQLPSFDDRHDCRPFPARGWIFPHATRSWPPGVRRMARLHFLENRGPPGAQKTPDWSALPPKSGVTPRTYYLAVPMATARYHSLAQMAYPRRILVPSHGLREICPVSDCLESGDGFTYAILLQPLVCSTMTAVP